MPEFELARLRVFWFALMETTLLSRSRSPSASFDTTLLFRYYCMWRTRQLDTFECHYDVKINFMINVRHDAERYEKSGTTFVGNFVSCEDLYHHCFVCVHHCSHLSTFLWHCHTFWYYPGQRRTERSRCATTADKRDARTSLFALYNNTTDIHATHTFKLRKRDAIFDAHDARRTRLGWDIRNTWPMQLVSTLDDDFVLI